VSSNDSIGKILRVAFALCIVCSVIVSAAAVMLKPAQEANKASTASAISCRRRACSRRASSVEEQFAAIEERYVDLRTGEFTEAVPAATTSAPRPRTRPVRGPGDEDIAKIGRQANVRPGLPGAPATGGDVDKIILPVHGYGLWSTLYGFLALESDANTVAGLGFYEHGETPGLGGEVDNPRWKAQWPGKKVYRDGEVELKLLKGSVDPPAPRRTGRSTACPGQP
jgi:Na+-transporting NADH:ubiquinone oxidoreductase subunit C